MIRVTAWPTVEWLHNRRVDRQPVETGRRGRPGADNAFRGRQVAETTSYRGPVAQTGTHARPPAPSIRFAAVLSRAAVTGTEVKASEWVSTPDGELPVAVVLERSGRRIAVCFSDRYESASESQDALVLVYGGFDALYCVRRVHTEDQTHDLVYALMCDLPSWFTLEGRIRAGRLASALAVVNVHTGNGRRRQLLGGASLERIRLCVASDWAQSFENVLNTPGNRLSEG